MEIVPTPDHQSRIPEGNPQTIAELFAMYAELAAGRESPRSAYNAKFIRRDFVKDFGARPTEQLRAIEIAQWLKAHPSWKSEWTKKRVLTTISTVFNWGIRMELTLRNPARNVPRETGETGRAMTDEEFQSMLRFADDPDLRRVILTLAFLGCRPKELLETRWSNVDLKQGMILLHEHKTKKKTHRPRIIPLPDAIVKLFTWMQKRSPGAIRNLLLEMLADGPVLIRDVLARVQALGVPGIVLERETNRLGIEVVRTIGVSGTSWSYRLPASARLDEDCTQFALDSEVCGDDHIFLNSRGKQWTREALCYRIQRICREAGLPEDARLYALRHRWATRGIMNGVPIKVVSECLGHVNTAVTEKHYLHVIATAGGVDYLRKGMEQAVRTIKNGKTDKPHQPPKAASPPPVASKSDAQKTPEQTPAAEQSAEAGLKQPLRRRLSGIVEKGGAA